MLFLKEFFGICMVIFFTLSPLIQLIKLLRDKNTSGISIMSYLMASLGLFCSIVYMIIGTYIFWMLVNSIISLILTGLIVYFAKKYNK
jgi:uncharacterized protein with PQ loop repeat